METVGFTHRDFLKAVGFCATSLAMPSCMGSGTGGKIKALFQE